MKILNRQVSFVLDINDIATLQQMLKRIQIGRKRRPISDFNLYQQQTFLLKLIQQQITNAEITELPTTNLIKPTNETLETMNVSELRKKRRALERALQRHERQSYKRMPSPVKVMQWLEDLREVKLEIDNKLGYAR